MMSNRSSQQMNVPEKSDDNLSHSVICSSDDRDEDISTDSPDLASDAISASAGIPEKDADDSTPQLTEKCTEHDELIKMFCQHHDVVCCSKCIALYHRTCEDVFFIPKLARKTLLENLTGEEKSLEYVLGELKEIEQQRVEEFSENAMDLKNDLEEIKQFKEQMETRIKHLVSKAENEVTERRNTVSLGLKNGVQMIQDMIKYTQTNLEKLKLTEKANASAAFVNRKMCMSLAEEARAITNDIREKKPENLKMYLDQGLQICLNGYTSLGELQVIQSGCAAQQIGKYNIRTFNDFSLPKVFDLCLTEAGYILLADISNNKIKKLDKSGNVRETLSIFGGPFGICNVSQNQVAVTVLNAGIVQLVDLTSSMKRGRSFSVDVRCRGICHLRGELFISCGGCVYLNDDEGPGHIRVYSLTGTLQRKIETDQFDQQIFEIPRHLVTTLDGEHIYVADNKKGLLVLTPDGTVTGVLNEQVIKQPYGVCLGEGRRLFVCSIDTHSVYPLEENGKVVSEPLGRAEGLYRPTAMKYCPERQELFVVTGSSSAMLTVFRMVKETEI